MEFKYQRDFFIRPLRTSDLLEVSALIRKESERLATQVTDGALSAVDSADALVCSRVILNSNGVLIGFFRIHHGVWDALAVNPNFLKQELREAVLKEIREWAMSHSGGKLQLQKNLIVSDWKSFLKQAQVRFEFEPPATEWLEF